AKLPFASVVAAWHCGSPSTGGASDSRSHVATRAASTGFACWSTTVPVTPRRNTHSPQPVVKSPTVSHPTHFHMAPPSQRCPSGSFPGGRPASLLSRWVRLLERVGVDELNPRLAGNVVIVTLDPQHALRPARRFERRRELPLKPP